MGELRPYSSQMQLWFRKELFFARQRHRTDCASFLSHGGENLYLMNNLLHAPVEGDIFKFGYRHGDKFQNFLDFSLKLKICSLVISNKVQTY